MKVNVNGQEVDTASGNLKALADEMSLPSSGVAMAVNNRMVSRAEWENCILSEGMNILIIRAACGG